MATEVRTNVLVELILKSGVVCPQKRHSKRATEVRTNILIKLMIKSGAHVFSDEHQQFNVIRHEFSIRKRNVGKDHDEQTY